MPTTKPAHERSSHEAAPSKGLAAYLTRAMGSLARGDWEARYEHPLLDGDAARRLGMQPRADLLLTGADATRVFIEVEISRADPVANQAKFLVVAAMERLYQVLAPRARDAKEKA